MKTNKSKKLPFDNMQNVIINQMNGRADFISGYSEILYNKIKNKEYNLTGILNMLVSFKHEARAIKGDLEYLNKNFMSKGDK